MFVDLATLLLGVLDRDVDKACILGLVGRSKEERGVGRRILALGAELATNIPLPTERIRTCGLYTSIAVYQRL